MPSPAKFAVRYVSPYGERYISGDLYWWHPQNQFSTVPITKYDTREEAEGGILWVIARKGADYIGSLEVVEVAS